MRKLMMLLAPFLFLMAMMVFFVVGVVLFFYIMVASIVIAAGIFLVGWIRAKFFTRKPQPTPKKIGRTFEHGE